MNPMERMCDFLGHLNEEHIAYRIQMTSECADSILVEIAIPGERWEVNLYTDGNVFVEKFVGTGEVFGADELNKLFE